MNKTQTYRRDLVAIFEGFPMSNIEKNLVPYLTSNSGLPGPRGNLELAKIFSELARKHTAKEPEELWELCIRLNTISAAEAPTNDPREFLAFCGTMCMGVFDSASRFFERSLSRLRELADDPRWRTREAVAMALQMLIEDQPEKTLRELESWIKDDNWLVMRAVAAGVAEPALLKGHQTAETALRLHRRILSRVLEAKDRRSDDFKTLKKGLSYSLSVVVSAIPEQGFDYIRQLISSRDRDLLAITKQNLTKNRLRKNFTEEVASMLSLLEYEKPEMSPQKRRIIQSGD